MNNVIKCLFYVTVIIGFYECYLFDEIIIFLYGKIAPMEGMESS